MLKEKEQTYNEEHGTYQAGINREKGKEMPRMRQHRVRQEKEILLT